MYERAIKIDKLLKPKRALIIYGARRTGKTTLVKQFLSHTNLKYRLDSGDNIRVRNILESEDFEQLADYIEGYELIAIDEAQQIRNIGRALKILTDEHPKLKIIVTGSSSFDLSQSVGEPLTGRKTTVVLYPMSLIELNEIKNKQELRDSLNSYLRYGLYPEVVSAKSKKEKENILRELADSYLLKDVLSLEKIKSSSQMVALLKLLAFQIGSEVSLNELATQVRLDVKTVGRYIDLLEKCFVIKKIGALSGNLRKEVTSKAKYYFYDLGVRNAVISIFNDVADRNDTGSMFENFVIMERIKTNAYLGRSAEYCFWRTYDGQEVDYVEVRDGKVLGYEIKWSDHKRAKPPAAWRKAYPNAGFTLLNNDNFLPFVLKAK